jgi:hypothetical protein
VSQHETDPDAPRKRVHHIEDDKKDDAVDIRLPRREIVLRHRYEIVSIANDILIAAWFTLGSILFFNEDTSRAGTWMFLIGSIQLAVRPAIRLSRLVHIQRRGSGLDTSTDY